MIVVLMGVSGSGKTVVGEALARRLDWKFEDADHYHSAANIEKMRNSVALTDEDRGPWLRSLNSAIRKWAADERDVVLACSALRETYRKMLREGISDAESIRFVYLKGTYDVIDKRLNTRAGHFMPESLLASQFAALEEPDSSEAFVADASYPVAQVVNAIVAGLQLSPARGPRQEQQ